MWHNISNNPVVKKTVTYREITIAIGVIVAMVVIALTLWIRVPGENLSGSGPRLSLPATAKYLVEPAIRIFSNDELRMTNDE